MRFKKYFVIEFIIIVLIGVLALLFYHFKNKFNIAFIKPKYNIILIISDQQAFHLKEAAGYQLPAHKELQRHGVTFTNHYTAAAMCSPSRASLLTGTSPQVHGVFDQMEYPYTPTLDPKLPNMGSVLKELGYNTAYFGKFEMDKSLLSATNTINTSSLIKSYGFDVFNPDGDTGGNPQQGFNDDPYFIGEAVRWLHQNALPSNNTRKPFFLVVSLLNPHDIMYADVNLHSYLPPVQIPAVPVIFSPPKTSLYARQWQFNLPETLLESLSAQGMPKGLLEYQNGWSQVLGFIPTDRKDMWHYYYNYYLNAIQDDDRNLQLLTDTLNQMDLWKNTIVIFTADHGEMGGAHGGLRGKGPMAYEENAHIPLIIDHPNAPQGVSCHALTSHLDLLPTLVGLTGMTSSLTANLSGHDFSSLLTKPQQADMHAIRSGVLFNYLGISTTDSSYLYKVLVSNFGKKIPFPSLTEVNLNKRGFLVFTFDGRYKFARFYAPNAFNTPKTFDEIIRNNDIQLFDLTTDPTEAHNLALEPEKNKALIMQMNELLNSLIAKEVGVNDGNFLPAPLKNNTAPSSLTITTQQEIKS